MFNILGLAKIYLQWRALNFVPLLSGEVTARLRIIHDGRYRKCESFRAGKLVYIVTPLRNFGTSHHIDNVTSSTKINKKDFEIRRNEAYIKKYMCHRIEEYE